MKVRGKWKKTLALLVSLAMLLGMMPDLTLTAVKAAAEENAAESTQTVTFEGIDGTGDLFSDGSQYASSVWL